MLQQNIAGKIHTLPPDRCKSPQSGCDRSRLKVLLCLNQSTDCLDSLRNPEPINYPINYENTDFVLLSKLMTKIKVKKKKKKALMENFLFNQKGLSIKFIQFLNESRSVRYRPQKK